MKNLKDILEQWRPNPGARPVEVDVDSSTTSDEPTTAIDRVTDVLTGSEEDGGGNNPLGDMSGVFGGRTTELDWEFNNNPTGQMKQDKQDAQADADSYTKGQIHVFKKPDGTEELVLAGKTLQKKPILFPVKQNESGEWGWINTQQGPDYWEPFKDY